MIDAAAHASAVHDAGERKKRLARLSASRDHLDRYAAALVRRWDAQR